MNNRSSAFTFVGLVVLISALSHFAMAQVESAPFAVTGRIEGNKELLAKARQSLGDHGCLAIRSKERWKAIELQLAELGWKAPTMPNLAEVDFDRHMILFVYKHGEEPDTFGLHHFDDKAMPPKASVVMSRTYFRDRGELVDRGNFLLAVVPQKPKLEVTVSTYMKANGSFYPTPDASRLEWRGVAGIDAGDVAGALRGKIEGKEGKIKAGDDILIQFALEFAEGAVVREGHFAKPVDSVSVWDGKYSNGYRNHAFEVRTPDGKTHFLRPAEILDWAKNAPHPVAIKAGAPYILPEWQEGKNRKSLKTLGLDTSKPGKYSITGIYMEAASKTTRNGVEHNLWGGTLATNTIVVEVADEK